MGLAAGWYDIIVRNECDTRDTFPEIEVVSLAAPELTDFEIVRPGCGAENGSINILGGEAASLVYSIDDWETDQEESLFTNLSGGMYTVVVSHEYGCTTTLETIAPEEVAAPVIQNVNETNPGCTDSDSGGITIVASSEESLL